METVECPLCKQLGAEAEGRERNDAYWYKCPRCGSFGLSRLIARTPMPSYFLPEALLPYLCAATRQRSDASNSVVITPDNARGLAELHAYSSIDVKLEKFLRMIARRAQVMGEPAVYDYASDYPLVDAKNHSEFIFLANFLTDEGYITDGQNHGALTVKGLRAIEPTAGPGGIPGRCFVAMAFRPDTDEAFDLGVIPAVQIDCDLPKPIRIDREPHNDQITNRVLAEIRKCHFLIADFTYHRGGVYFEAGYALGLGRTVIWSCRRSDKDNLHFDTQQYNHILWDSPADLRQKLAERIQETVTIPVRFRTVTEEA